MRGAATIDEGGTLLSPACRATSAFVVVCPILPL